jgi:hypothetical protein
MKPFIAFLVLLLPACAQSPLRENNPDFARVLDKVLAAVSIGSVPAGPALNGPMIPAGFTGVPYSDSFKLPAARACRIENRAWYMFE